MNTKHLFIFLLCSSILLFAFSGQYYLNNISYYEWVINNQYNLTTYSHEYQYYDYLNSALHNNQYNPYLKGIMLFSIILSIISGLYIYLKREKTINIYNGGQEEYGGN